MIAKRKVMFIRIKKAFAGWEETVACLAENDICSFEVPSVVGQQLSSYHPTLLLIWTDIQIKTINIHNYCVVFFSCFWFSWFARFAPWAEGNEVLFHREIANYSEMNDGRREVVSVLVIDDDGEVPLLPTSLILYIFTIIFHNL